MTIPEYTETNYAYTFKGFCRRAAKSQLGKYLVKNVFVELD